MTKVYGIDVSHHQGAINWEKTAAELRRVNGGTSPGFCILRAGYSARHGRGGLVTDNQALANMNGCAANGIPMGIYFYCYDQSAEAARITAQQVLKLIRGYKFDYPIFYDVEYEPFNKTCGKAVNTAMIQAALKVFEDAGYYAAVYCSRDFFLNYTNLSALTGFDKWEAAYTATDTTAVENGMWQYSSKNALGIAGFGASLDCDVAYKDYPSIMRRAGLNGYPKPAENRPAAAEGNEPPASDPRQEGNVPAVQHIAITPPDRETAAAVAHMAFTLRLPQQYDVSPGDALEMRHIAELYGCHYETK